MSYKNRKDIKDFVTDAFRGIQVDHANIHEGSFFEYPVMTSIAPAGTYVIGLKTSANDYVHYRNEKLSCSGDKVSVALQEIATISGGTTVTAINHNRTSTATSSVLVKTGVTLSTAGTTVSIGYVGGGTGVGGSRSGGETTERNEYILKQNTQYAIVVANNIEATNTIVISPQWYEEEEGV